MSIWRPDRSTGGFPPLLVVLAAVLQLVPNLLPAMGLGTPVGSQSNMVRTLLTPSGWAFAIWGPLYLGTLLFAAWQWLPSGRASALARRLRLPATVAFLANGFWVLHTQFAGIDALSVLIILTGLSALVWSLHLLAGPPDFFSAGERWFVALPLGALAGWIMAASIVNITASLRFHGLWEGPPNPLLAALTLVAGGVIASAVSWRARGNPWFAKPFLWALLAIAQSPITPPMVEAGAAAAGLILILATLWRIGRDPARRRWILAER